MRILIYLFRQKGHSCFFHLYGQRFTHISFAQTKNYSYCIHISSARTKEHSHFLFIHIVFTFHPRGQRNIHIFYLFILYSHFIRADKGTFTFFIHSPAESAFTKRIQIHSPYFTFIITRHKSIRNISPPPNFLFYKKKTRHLLLLCASATLSSARLPHNLEQYSFFHLEQYSLHTGLQQHSFSNFEPHLSALQP